MPDDYVDPSGNTEAFRAFAADGNEPDPSTTAASNLPLFIALGVAAVVIVAGLIWLVS